MKTKHEQIKKYIYDLTKGLVSLKEQHTEEIIRIATERPDSKAVLRKWDYRTNEYDIIRTIETTKGEINRVIQKHGRSLPTYGFYRWDLYSPKDTHVISIYSVNSQLF